MSDSCEPEDVASDEKDDLLAILEAMLFAAHESVSAQRLARSLGGLRTARVEAALRRLEKDLENRRAPLQLVEIAGGFRLVTRPEFAPYLARLFHKSDKERLSPATLETLAIVAYRQPITRADVEGVRGVQVGPILRLLQERRLVKVVGRAPVVGRPQLYGTTRKFLDVFGLKSLEELPRIQSQLRAESNGLASSGHALALPDQPARVWQPEDAATEDDTGDDAAAEPGVREKSDRPD